MNLDKFRHVVLYASLVVFPLTNIGFKYGFFWVSIPMLFMYFLSVVSVPFLAKDRWSLVGYGFLVGYFFVGSICRWPPSMVFKPIFAFVLISMPVIANYRSVSRDQLFRWLSYGLAVALFADAFQLLVYMSGAASYSAIFGDFVVTPTIVDSRFGTMRFKGLFTEPAHQGIYGAFVMFITMFYGVELAKSRWHLWFCAIGAVFLVLSSMSLSGVALACVVIALFLVKGGFFRLRSILIFILVVVGFSCSLTLPVMQDVVVSRVERLIYSFGVFDLRAAEVSRSHAILITVEYVKETGFIGFLFGEGYGNFEFWLARAFAGSYTSFANGQIPNLLAALFLGTGAIGVSLFFNYMLIVLRFLKFRLRVLLILFFFALFFVFGTIVSNIFWGMLLVVRIVFDERKSVMPPHPCHYRLR